MEKFYLLVYGCQMNAAEGESVRETLLRENYEETSDMTKADIILLHTCCVREAAEEKVYGKIGEIKNIKRNNPSVILGVMGCMAQKESEKLFKRAPHIDFILGTGKLGELINTISAIKNERKHILKNELNSIESLPVSVNKTSVFVPIMTGCNNFCSYCIVPYVRGREKSRDVEDILNDVKNAVKNGAKELTFLGQNVNSYAPKDGADFSDLLKLADSAQGVSRIRFMTSHPKDLSDKLIETMAKGKHIARHIHLPMQHASNRILKAMNRNYTKEHYLNLLQKLRENIPNIAVTTDLIVGFPTETEEDFAELLDFVKIAKWDAAYTFIYSKRSGTPAANIAEQTEESVKHERLNRLMETQNIIGRKINDALKDTVLEVLVEGESKTKGVYQGRSDTNKLVLFPHSGQQAGDIVNIRIKEPQTWVLKGEVV
ncbi:MAG: tRNA (N6-isopentenyl adenosine(37)-C2)-methylthiotransferase MiaB [Selenomonadaceae bacterium]|nr:tRNA (N6-isopentenyl adenosine(37)-C2)-methylthiotransferase MiaB [Selenomonadaceae bacterium]MBP3722557.1 tRNA (N6-isopentenyl adenosine(37)-C2)-methylthiotransferase MiaB [Selenomonadaceae bacterium]